MPWCEHCSRYLTPSSVSPDGTCPQCGREPEHNTIHGRPVTGKDIDLRELAGEDGEKVPWHFTLLLVLLCAYLGWRIVQLFA
ncbi:MAG: hypothetical protein RLZZ305_1096 [Actinomycetota bacterium]